MMSVLCFRILVLRAIVCSIVFMGIAAGDEPSLTGEFPYEDVIAVYSGPFTQLDRSDLLVVQGAGGIAFQSHRGGVGMGAARLALYSFDGSKFQRIWENGSLMLGYSLPKDGPISAMTWCYGDFDGDGGYSIITCNVKEMRQYTFEEKAYEQHKMPMQELIQTPDVWIDQLIACDINDDSIDELVALNYPDNPDSCCIYHAAIYKIVGDKPAGRSLVELWQGLDHIGSNSGIFPPNHFISTCRIEGVPGEVPVIMGPQSDVSLSSYIAIGKAEVGDYEVKRPFPRPEQSHLKKGDEGAREEHERINKSTIGPVGGVIFNDGDRILHYGIFLDYNAPGPDNKSIADNFAVLEDGHWRSLQKQDPSIGGLLTKFSIESGKSGWLFIKDGKYFFYDKLPVSD